MSQNFSLDDDEREMLAEILTDRLGTLREQIYHTDTPGFHDGLKEEEQRLRGILGKLGSAPEPYQSQEGEHRIERGPIERVG